MTDSTTDDNLTFSRAQLVAAFFAWGTARKNGECMSHEDADALSTWERAKRDAATLISFL